jgi:hypothetical protein
MKPNINRSLPPYMPTKEALLLIWIEQFLNALKPMLGMFEIEQAEYDDDLERFALLKNAYTCHINSDGVAKADTLYKNLGFYDRNHLQATAPRQEADIFPSSSAIEGGFVWRLVELIDEKILPSRYCTEDIKRQLQILPPDKPHPDWHTQTFIIEGNELLDGAPNLIWKKGPNTAATFQYKEQSEDDAHWHGAGTYISSPSPLAIPQHEQPRVVEVMGRYLKGNRQVGNWSAAYPLTIPAAKKPTV